jgi:hypothetical protein
MPSSMRLALLAATVLIAACKTEKGSQTATDSAGRAVDTTTVVEEPTTLHPDTVTAEQDRALNRLWAAHHSVRPPAPLFQRTECAWAKIPEYDDEQAFAYAGAYGKTVHLFGCHGQGLTDENSFGNYVLMGKIWVEPGSGSAATAPYQHLGIDQGEQFCVFIRKAGVAGWGALIVPPSSNGCVKPPSSTQPNLRMAALTNPESRGLPESVRFMPSKSDTLVYIGTRCANKWCVIGTDNENDLAESAPGGFAHGWYDYQALGDDTGGLHPTRERAYVIANRNLRSLHIPETGMVDPQWVAVVHFESSVPAKYYAKGFRVGDNKIWLKIEQPGTADGVDGTGFAFVSNDTFPNGYSVKINAKRMVFPKGFDAPAVARWGWNPKDEDIWIRCDLGCCMIEISM